MISRILILFCVICVFDYGLHGASQLRPVMARSLHTMLTINNQAYVSDLVSYPELAKYFKKHNYPVVGIDGYNKGSQIDRIINADRLLAVMKHYKLDRWTVARKCINENWSIISQHVKPGDQNQPLSLEEVQQLGILTKATLFHDFGFSLESFGGNIIRNEEGKLVFIDTEDSSFGGVSPNLGRLAMEPKAQEWVKEQQNCKKKSVSGLIAFCKNIIYETPALPANIKYDDPDIDLEQVKKEFKMFRVNDLYNRLVQTGQGMGSDFEISMTEAENPVWLRQAIIEARHNNKKLDLRKALLNGLNLSGLDISGGDFSGADLCGINLKNTVAIGTNFSNSCLSFAKFDGANTFGAIFNGAQLDDTTGLNSHIKVGK